MMELILFYSGVLVVCGILAHFENKEEYFGP
jgi:hypothetical protein